MNQDRPTTIAAAVALSCIGVFGLLPQPIFVGALQDVLHFSPQQAGVVSAAEVFGGAIASVLASFWIRKIDWRLAGGLAIVVVAVGNLASSLVSNYQLLLGLRLAVGLFGEGTAFAVAIGILSQTSQQERNFAYAIAAQVAFGVIGFATLPHAVTQWQIGGILLPLATLALLAGIVIRWVPAGGSGTGGAAGPARGGPAPALVALAALLIWCIGLGGIYAFEERIGVAAGIERTAVGNGLAVAVAVGFLGAMTASVVADRFGRLAPVALALLAQVVAVWLLQGELSWMRFAVTASVFHFFWNFTGPYLMGAVGASDATGRIAVLMPAAQTGGFAIGTALAGNLMSGTSLLPANLVAIAGCLLALLVFLPTAARLRTGHAVAVSDG